MAMNDVNFKIEFHENGRIKSASFGKNGNLATVSDLFSDKFTKEILEILKENRKPIDYEDKNS